MLKIYVSTCIIPEKLCDWADYEIPGEDCFEKNELKEFLTHTDLDFDEDLKIDNKGRIQCKKDKKGKEKKVRVPVINIAGSVKINSMIYSPGSKLSLAGKTVYTGNLFVKELKATGAGTISINILSEEKPEEDKNHKKSVMNISKGQPDPTFKLNDVYSYPNPAKGGVNPIIHIEVGIADTIELRIYNIAGELMNSNQLAGTDYIEKSSKYCYEYEWNTQSIASGVYVYLIKAQKGVETIKVLKKIGIIK